MLPSAPSQITLIEGGTPAPAPAVVPSAPRDLAGETGDSQITLTWTAVAETDSYRVERSLSLSGPFTSVGTPTSPTLTDTGLSNGTTYAYRVFAVNGVGDSDPSTAIAVDLPASPPPTPDPPTGLTAVAGNAQVLLTWVGTDAAIAYIVKRGVVDGGPYGTVVADGITATTLTDLNLTNNTTYYYVVVAVTVTGNSGNSAQASATPQAVVVPPDPPPDPPPDTGGGNAYYDSLVLLPSLSKAYHFRSQAQLLQYKVGAGTPEVNYLWPTDTDAHKQDAAKIVVPAFEPFTRAGLAVALDASTIQVVLDTWTSEFVVNRAVKFDSEVMKITAISSGTKTLTVQRAIAGTTAAPHAIGARITCGANGIQTGSQIRVPIDTVSGHTYLFTWDLYYTDSYMASGLKNHKAFQFSNSQDKFYLQPDMTYDGSTMTPTFNPATDICAAAMFTSCTPGGSAIYANNGGAFKIGPGYTNNDPIKPQHAPFVVRPNRWTRMWMRLILNQNDYDLFDYWVADETRAAVQVYAAVPITGSINAKFWIEFNTSQVYYRGNIRPLVCYVRNFVMLKDPASLPPFTLPV